MKPFMRNYQSDEDYWCIREFLREVSLCNDRRDFSWPLLRWDYWRWHGIENMFHFQLQDIITLWEMNGQIVAMLNPESMGEAFFQIHPGFRAEVSMAEMLDVAENKLSRTNDDGKTELVVWVNAGDKAAKTLFTGRGYARSNWNAEHMRSRPFTHPIPESGPQGGYTVRALGDESGPRAEISGADRGHRARLAGTDHEEIYLALLHVRSSASQRSA